MSLKILGNEADPVVASPPTLYSPAAGKQAAVVINIVNRTAGDLAATVDLIPTGGSAGIDTKMLDQEPIPARSSAQFGVALGPLDAIEVFGSAAGLTFIAHGDETDVNP